jgi:3-phosphoshikimate 1-carboxyvinyltransferase
MLPITAAIGAESTFYMRGRLPYRPLSPLYELLEQNGIYLTPQGTNPLITSGKLWGKDFSISANISSQFISGLMFAIPLLQRFDGKNEEEDTPSSLALIGNIESSPYIDMTLDALREFGVAVEEAYPNADRGETKKYLFPPECAFTSPLRLEVEGDWSNAAFWLAAGAIGKEPIKVTSLNTRSHQGDMEMIKLLRNFGADVIVSGDEVTVFPARLRGTRINAAQIPDLVPILAVVAALSEGETTIFGASRLRLKESDRLLSVSAMLSALGANIKETSDGLVINGVPRLKGGRVDSAGDHRIAMAAAIASIACENGVLISGAEATQKSYPKFWEDFERLSK